MTRFAQPQFNHRNLALPASHPTTGTPLYIDIDDALDAYIKESPRNELSDRFMVAELLRTYDTLTPSDDVCIHGYRTITTLPNGFNPQGNISVSNCQSFTHFPSGFNPQGMVCINQCPAFTHFPDGFNPFEGVNISHCNAFTHFPRGFNPQGSVSLSYCPSFTGFPDGFNPGGDVDLWGCTLFSHFPNSFNPSGDVIITNCDAFTHFPDGFNQGADILISDCAAFTHLPDGFNPSGNVVISNCPVFTNLPIRFTPKGNIDVSLCTAFTDIPESLFLMPRNAYVSLQHTGLTATTVHRINERQNSPGYQGPRFDLSINEIPYISEVGVSAQKLPDILEQIGHHAAHPLWNFAASQFHKGSIWNPFAQFLSRLLNEVPRPSGQISKALADNLSQTFTLMEREYSEDPAPTSSPFIASVLNSAQRGVGTCVDKVKVGYVLIQLYTRHTLDQPDDSSASRAIQTVERVVDFVSDLNLNRTLFDTQSHRFVSIDIAPYESAHTTYHLSLTDPNSGITHSNTTIPLTFSPSSAFQQFILQLNETFPSRFQAVRVGDETEDILFLTYQLITNLHKPDLKFNVCRTLKDPVLINAALCFITQQAQPPKDPG